MESCVESLAGLKESGEKGRKGPGGGGVASSIKNTRKNKGLRVNTKYIIIITKPAKKIL